MEPAITHPGTDELTLPNHPETKVWMKRKARFGERNRVGSLGILSRREVAPGKFETDPAKLALFIATRTIEMIHDWTVTDESGKRAPIVVEALESMDTEDGDFLATEAKKRYDSGAAPLPPSSEPSSATESNPPIPPPTESPE